MRLVENVLLLLLVFGAAKAALIPLHGWLPAAMVAPAPVSAMLHAVAVVKAGVFTILKVSAYIFGPELITALPAATWLLWIAAATIVIASLVALTKDDLKARLAWSTVGQLAYITSAAMLPMRCRACCGRAAHDRACGRQDHALHVRGRDLCRDGGQRRSRRWAALGRRMPIVFTCFFAGLAVGDRPAADGRACGRNSCWSMRRSDPASG